jgi:hypothetical protein
MVYSLIVGISNVQRVYFWDANATCKFFALSLKLLLLFCHLLMLLKQWDFEKAIETSFFKTWNSPLYDNVNLFLLIGWLHLELAYYK